MKKLALLIALASFVSLAGPALSPLQLSIFPPVQIVPETTEVIGLKLNLIYGYNQEVMGFDCGVASSVDRFSGIQANIINDVKDEATAALQVGALNLTSLGNGIEVAAVNYSECKYSGLQVGAINIVGDMNGLQIGVINQCVNLHGMQIGLANIVNNSPVPFMLVLNVCF